MGPDGGDLGLSGDGGGISEEDIGPVYEFLNGKYTGQAGMPPVDFGGPAGDGLSVGGNPMFAGKGFGGGGFGIMDIGGDFTRSMMASNPNFIPSLYGLMGESSDYLPGGKYGIKTEDSMPGGYDSTGYSVGDDRVVLHAMKREDKTPLEGRLAMQMDPSFLDPGGIGSLSPTAPTPFEQETGIFGGTLGPKLKNAIPAGLREFLGNVASLHPATMNAVLMGKLVKGWQSADDKGKFMRNVMKGLAMRKMMGNFGLDRTQKALVGTGIDMARGKQNMAQGIGNFATDAGINQLMRNVLPKAYEAQGMNGVYAAIAAIKMLRQRAKEGISSLGGPGGGG